MRARWVKPEFFNDRKIGKMGPVVALVYQALWCMADDGGTAICTPEIIKGQMFVWWPAVGLPEIAEALRQLGESNRITRYTVGDEDYAQIVRWEKHQSVHNPSKFRYPKPQQQVTGNTAAALPQEGGSTQHLDTQIPRPLDPQTPRHGEGKAAPPRVVLPENAEKFLRVFYEAPAMTEAARKRYRDVKGQLYDVLDPEHPGPIIRGGTRVKARSIEHLADELEFVLKNPPPDRDLAIVWLLKRLTNPPKGPSVAEVKHREEATQRRLEDEYHAAMRQAGIRWANEHPEEYAKIVAAVDAAHGKGATGWQKIARDAALAQKCAAESEFPSFEQWCSQTSNRQVAIA